MIVLAKPAHDRRAYTLVNQKSHLNGLGRNGDEGGILEGLGGKEKTGIDVVLHQAGILHQDLLHGGAMGQESQDVLRSEPGAPDDWFAYHYFGIYGDPFQQIFINHEDSIGCSFDTRIDQKEVDGTLLFCQRGMLAA
jgi:hypothetical protein